MLAYNTLTADHSEGDSIERVQWGSYSRDSELHADCHLQGGRCPLVRPLPLRRFGAMTAQAVSGHVGKLTEDVWS
jgi:hypothetical protein